MTTRCEGPKIAIGCDFEAAHVIVRRIELIILCAQKTPSQGVPLFAIMNVSAQTPSLLVRERFAAADDEERQQDLLVFG